MRSQAGVVSGTWTLTGGMQRDVDLSELSAAFVAITISVF